MPLRFVDCQGNEGEINDEFSVDYDGLVQVEEYVQDIEEAADSPEEAVNNLIFDLPEDLAIREVEQIS